MVHVLRPESSSEPAGGLRDIDTHGPLDIDKFSGIDAGIPVEFDASQVVFRYAIPDLCEYPARVHLVSPRARGAIESLAPGCAVFSAIYPRDRFGNTVKLFRLLVTRQAQLAHWSEYRPEVEFPFPAPNGKKLIMASAHYLRYRRHDRTDPHLWRERPIETETAFCAIHPWQIFMSDYLWERLDGLFPENLSAFKMREVT